MSRESEPACRWIEQGLRGCLAFLVDAEDGTEVGVVDDVLFDSEGRVAQIDVRSGWFGRGRRTFDLTDVVAVAPSRRLVVVSNAAVARPRRKW